MRSNGYSKTSQIFVHLCVGIFMAVLNNPTAAAAKVVVIPLVDDHISAIRPSDVLHLTTGLVAPSGQGNVLRISTSGINEGHYMVPTGKYLVITSVTIFPQTPGAGNIQLQLVQNNAVRNYWVVPNSEPTQLSFGPGILIPSGYTLSINNISSSAGAIRVRIYGYLTDQ